MFGAVNPALARAGVGRFVGTALSNTAAAIAGAGAQSLLTGSDFGDTLMRSLPQVIGETIGNTVGEAIGDADRPQTSMARMRGKGGVEYAASGQIVSDGPEIIVRAQRHGLGWRLADALGFHGSFVRGLEAGLGAAEQGASSLIARAIAYAGQDGGATAQAWSIASSPTSSLNRSLGAINQALQPTRLVAGAISLAGVGESIDSIQASIRYALDDPADVIGDIAPAFFGAPLGAAVEEEVTVAERAGASFGIAPSSDYRATFFAAHPELEGQVIVHHAVEQQVLIRFPGLVSEAEMHSLENLRGIPKELDSDIHLSQIRRDMNQFYRLNPTPTKQQLLDNATRIDIKYGSQFKPPR